MFAATSASYHVIVGSRSVEKGEKAIAEINSTSPKGTLSLLQLDVTNEMSIINAVATVTKDFGRVDVLINNAGIVSTAKNLATQLRETFETNTIGPAVMTEEFTPLLLKSSKAKLIYVSSGLGSITTRLDPANPYYKALAEPYRLSKAALNMLMACDYARLGDKGVMAWAFCPGYVITNLTGEEGIKQRKASGAKSPTESADGLLAIVEGKRDAEVGKFVHKDGVYGW